MLTLEAIDSSNDDELVELLGKTLEAEVQADKGSPQFLAEIKSLPAGLRAMAATHEFDVSMTLDDLGWHFGNWHDEELAEETASGLEALGSKPLADAFRDGFRIAQKYWAELGKEGWMDWYHGSDLEKEIRPVNEKIRKLRDPERGIFKLWVDYARRHPEGLGVSED